MAPASHLRRNALAFLAVDRAHQHPAPAKLEIFFSAKMKPDEDEICGQYLALIKQFGPNKADALGIIDEYRKFLECCKQRRDIERAPCLGRRIIGWIFG